MLEYYGQSLDLDLAWPQAAQYLPFEWTGQDVVTFCDDGPVGSGGTDSIFGVNDVLFDGRREVRSCMQLAGIRP